MDDGSQGMDGGPQTLGAGLKDPDDHHSVLITGVGLATSLGLDLETTWKSVVAAQCGIGPSLKLEQSPTPDAGYGQCPRLPSSFMPHADEPARYLRWAMDQALRDARIDWSRFQPSRVAVMLGTTLHGMPAAGRYFRNHDLKQLRTFQAASVVRQALDGLPVSGWALTTCAACASGLASVALGVTLLQSERYDLVIAGGYDPVSEYAYAGFSSLRLVTPAAQKPFAKSRQGLKLAEGYGIVILEKHDAATRRAAPVFAVLAGLGASSDAHHLSQPHPEGRGAADAMRQALMFSRVSSSEIDLIAAHATATPDNDGAEYKAMQAVFSQHLPDIPVTAFKSHLGHSLGAAGAVELILAGQAMREGVVPALAHVGTDEVGFEGLDVVTKQSRAREVKHAMVTSLGFGGSNACVVISKLEASNIRSAQARPVHRVCVTGLGVVLPGLVGCEAFSAHIKSNTRSDITADTGAVDESLYMQYLQARRIRRLSEYVKISLAATAMAVQHAGLSDAMLAGGRMEAISGTTHGSANFSRDYYQQIVEQGLASANPLLFAEGVPNAGSAHLSMMLNLRGSCQTLVGSRTAGLDAVILAHDRIQTGQCEAVIVNAADEYSDLVNKAYESCGLSSWRSAIMAETQDTGFMTGAGSVTLVLESEESAMNRGVQPLAWLGHCGQILWNASGGEGVGANAWQSIAALIEGMGAGRDVACSVHRTWLDRVELPAIRRALGKAARVGSVYGMVAECFSAMPLVSLAACILTKAAPGHAPSDSGLVVMASDYNGLTSAICLDVL